MHLLKIMSLVERILLFMAALILLAMALITFVDVTGRYLFNTPVQGAFELIGMGMALLIFAALPEVTARGTHVAVSLVGFLSKSIQAVLGVIMAALVSAAFCILAWRLFEHAKRMADYGDYAMFTGIPYAPIAFFMAFCAAVAGVFRAVRLSLDPSELLTSNKDQPE